MAEDDTELQLNITVCDGDTKENKILKCASSAKIYTEVTSQCNLKEFTLLYEGDKVDKRRKAVDFTCPLIAITKKTPKEVTCEVTFTESVIGTNNHKIKFERNGKIKDLVKNCGLLYNFNDTCTLMTNDDKEYKDKMEELIVLTALHKPFKIEFKGEPPTQYKIKVMAEIMPSPSEYGKDPQETKKELEKKGLKICDHRNGDNGDDVTKHYQRFKTFIDQCDSTVLDGTDRNVRDRMCTEMSKYFSSEKERQNKFIKLMNDYICETYCVMESGGSSTRYDGYINPCKCVILEVKNESGQGGESDSYAQIIAYYVKSLEEKPVDRYPAPAFLLELVGPHLFISGAVYYCECVYVDRLVDSVWLVPDQRDKAMIRIAQIFKALKDAIIAIKSYYE